MTEVAAVSGVRVCDTAQHDLRPKHCGLRLLQAVSHDVGSGCHPPHFAPLVRTCASLPQGPVLSAVLKCS